QTQRRGKVLPDTVPLRRPHLPQLTAGGYAEVLHAGVRDERVQHPLGVLAHEVVAATAVHLLVNHGADALADLVAAGQVGADDVIRLQVGVTRDNPAPVDVGAVAFQGSRQRHVVG